MKHSALKSLLKKQGQSTVANGEVTFLNIEMTGMLIGGVRSPALVSTCDVKSGSCSDLNFLWDVYRMPGEMRC